MAATKKSTTAKKSTKGSRTARPTSAPSFKVTPEHAPFLTFSVTRQTLYWVVIAAVVLALGIWVISINARLQSLYNQVQTNTSNSLNTIITKKK